MRKLRFDIHQVKQEIESLNTIPFPLGSTSSLFDITLSTLYHIDRTDPNQLITLLNYADIFRIFDHFSALRSKLL